MVQTVYYGLDKLEPNKANYVDRLNALLELLGGGLGDYTGQLSLAGLSGNVDLTHDLARRPAVRLTGNPTAAVTLKLPTTGRAIIHVVNQCGGSFSTVTVKSAGANTSNAAGVPLSTGQAQFIRHDANSAYAASSIVNPSASSPLTQDLQAFWRFEEPAGARNDSAGVNHLTAFNGVTQAAGKVGFASGFNSALSQYLSVAHNSALSVGDIDFTLACAVRLDTKTATQDILAKFGASGNFGYVLTYDLTTDRFVFYVSPTGTGVVSVAANALGSPAVATWYQIVAYHDSVNNLIGIKVNNGAGNTTAHATGVFNSTAPFQIGARSSGPSYLNARLDAAGFWRGRVLSPSDHTLLWNSGNLIEYPF